MDSTIDARLVVILVIFLILAGWPVVTIGTRRRLMAVDRRRIMGDGAICDGTVTQISTPASSGRCWVHLQYRPMPECAVLRLKQQTTQSAVQRRGLSAGATVRVRYLREKPAQAFIHELVLAERNLPVRSPFATEDSHPDLFYVWIKPPNKLGWDGPGDIIVSPESVQFNVQKSRPFWYPKLVRREFAASRIHDVEITGELVACTISIEDGAVRRLQFLAVNSDAAQSLGRQLPTTKTNDFVESAAFQAALAQLNPQTPVTYGLIIVNLLIFAVAGALGAGVLRVDPEAMIRLGTDYTPLTLGGQWWRLFSSMFLHFGILHIGFNMWALFSNGRLAERVFGHARYLFIYLTAGVTGSVTSLLWHPVVNGAGASGAIFGIIGAMMAFFAKRVAGVPLSIAKAQLRSMAVYAAYALLAAARIPGIDNAAHLGGVCAGFVLGLILTQPIDVTARASNPWKAQWSLALGLVSVTAALLAFLLVTGKIEPRTAHDPSGRPIPRAALGLPLRVLGGFRIGMTADEVLANKGPPLLKDASGWVYNSVDATHDGVLTLFYSKQKSDHMPTVVAIEFTGHDQSSAPAEMPYFNSSGSEDAVRQFGEPFNKRSTNGTTMLYFRNGTFVALRDDKIYSYGIFNTAVLQ